VIAAVAGAAVAGGMELALWCDMRVMEEDAYFGVYCRRWGVPLVDGGTVRLPRIVGMGRAMDLILTGRKVEADEALRIGLCERVVPRGRARAEAETIAHEIAHFPQGAVRADRRSAYETHGLSVREALKLEWLNGMPTWSRRSAGRRSSRAAKAGTATSARSDATRGTIAPMTAPIVPQAVGEEFREDVRKKLPPEELAPLTRLDPLRSTIAVAQTYVLLALVIGFAIAFWSWWAAAIAVVLIAPLQHALFVLAHDGAHYRLYETRWLNDAVGRLCGTIAGVSM
jgi:hypothetical protein